MFKNFFQPTKIDEDFYFNAVAEKRDTPKARFLSHEDVWNDF